jgi:hypothetical protein
VPRKPTNQFIVRLPPDLDAWVEAQAEQNCRSKNGEILFHLKAARAAEQSRQDGGATAAGQASQG